MTLKGSYIRDFLCFKTAGFVCCCSLQNRVRDSKSVDKVRVTVLVVSVFCYQLSGDRSSSYVHSTRVQSSWAHGSCMPSSGVESSWLHTCAHPSSCKRLLSSGKVNLGRVHVWKASAKIKKSRDTYTTRDYLCEPRWQNVLCMYDTCLSRCCQPQNLLSSHDQLLETGVRMRWRGFTKTCILCRDIVTRSFVSLHCEFYS
jgi:hypothetical protein